MLAICLISLTACDDDKPRDNIYTEQDPQIYISQPEGRMVVREGLKNLENWANRPNFIYTPFTELVFDEHRNEVEVIDEDKSSGSYKLVRLGNGHYRLDNLYELRYNSKGIFWQLFTLGEQTAPLTLDSYTMPDTVKISDISAYKYMVHRNLIAGVYYVTDKAGNKNMTSSVAFAPDGQLIGVKGFSKYNLIVNGDRSDCELMPIELTSHAGRIDFWGCVERQDSLLTLYKLVKTKGTKPKHTYQKGDIFAKLIRISGQVVQ